MKLQCAQEQGGRPFLLRRQQRERSPPLRQPRLVTSCLQLAALVVHVLPRSSLAAEIETRRTPIAGGANNDEEQDRGEGLDQLHQSHEQQEHHHTSKAGDGEALSAVAALDEPDPASVSLAGRVSSTQHSTKATKTGASFSFRGAAAAAASANAPQAATAFLQEHEQQRVRVEEGVNLNLNAKQKQNQEQELSVKEGEKQKEGEGEGLDLEIREYLRELHQLELDQHHFLQQIHKLDFGVEMGISHAEAKRRFLARNRQRGSLGSSVWGIIFPLTNQANDTDQTVGTVSTVTWVQTLYRLVTSGGKVVEELKAAVKGKLKILGEVTFFLLFELSAAHPKADIINCALFDVKEKLGDKNYVPQFLQRHLDEQTDQTVTNPRERASVDDKKGRADSLTNASKEPGVVAELMKWVGHAAQVLVDFFKLVLNCSRAAKDPVQYDPLCKCEQDTDDPPQELVPAVPIMQTLSIGPKLPIGPNNADGTSRSTDDNVGAPGAVRGPTGGAAGGPDPSSSFASLALQPPNRPMRQADAAGAGGSSSSTLYSWSSSSTEVLVDRSRQRASEDEEVPPLLPPLARENHRHGDLVPSFLQLAKEAKQLSRAQRQKVLEQQRAESGMLGIINHIKGSGGDRDEKTPSRINFVYVLGRTPRFMFFVAIIIDVLQWCVELLPGNIAGPLGMALSIFTTKLLYMSPDGLKVSKIVSVINSWSAGIVSEMSAKAMWMCRFSPYASLSKTLSTVTGVKRTPPENTFSWAEMLAFQKKYGMKYADLATWIKVDRPLVLAGKTLQAPVGKGASLAPAAGPGTGLTDSEKKKAGPPAAGKKDETRPSTPAGPSPPVSKNKEEAHDEDIKGKITTPSPSPPPGASASSSAAAPGNLAEPTPATTPDSGPAPAVAPGVGGSAAAPAQQELHQSHQSDSAPSGGASVTVTGVAKSIDIQANLASRSTLADDQPRPQQLQSESMNANAVEAQASHKEPQTETTTTTTPSWFGVSDDALKAQKRWDAVRPRSDLAELWISAHEVKDKTRKRYSAFDFLCDETISQEEIDSIFTHRVKENLKGILREATHPLLLKTVVLGDCEQEGGDGASAATPAAQDQDEGQGPGGGTSDTSGQNVEQQIQFIQTRAGGVEDAEDGAAGQPKPKFAPARSDAIERCVADLGGPATAEQSEGIMCQLKIPPDHLKVLEEKAPQLTATEEESFNPKAYCFFSKYRDLFHKMLQTYVSHLGQPTTYGLRFPTLPAGSPPNIVLAALASAYVQLDPVERIRLHNMLARTGLQNNSFPNWTRKHLLPFMTYEFPTEEFRKSADMKLLFPSAVELCVAPVDFEEFSCNLQHKRRDVARRGVEPSSSTGAAETVACKTKQPQARGTSAPSFSIGAAESEPSFVSAARNSLEDHEGETPPVEDSGKGVATPHDHKQDLRQGPMYSIGDTVTICGISRKHPRVALLEQNQGQIRSIRRSRDGRISFVVWLNKYDIFWVARKHTKRVFANTEYPFPDVCQTGEVGEMEKSLFSQTATPDAINIMGDEVYDSLWDEATGHQSSCIMKMASKIPQRQAVDDAVTARINIGTIVKDVVAKGPQEEKECQESDHKHEQPGGPGRQPAAEPGVSDGQHQGKKKGSPGASHQSDAPGKQAKIKGGADGLSPSAGAATQAQAGDRPATQQDSVPVEAKDTDTPDTQSQVDSTHAKSESDAGPSPSHEQPEPAPGPASSDEHEGKGEGVGEQDQPASSEPGPQPEEQGEPHGGQPEVEGSEQGSPSPLGAETPEATTPEAESPAETETETPATTDEAPDPRPAPDPTTETPAPAGTPEEGQGATGTEAAPAPWGGDWQKVGDNWQWVRRRPAPAPAGTSTGEAEQGGAHQESGAGNSDSGAETQEKVADPTPGTGDATALAAAASPVEPAAASSSVAANNKGGESESPDNTQVQPAPEEGEREVSAPAPPVEQAASATDGAAGAGTAGAEPGNSEEGEAQPEQSDSEAVQTQPSDPDESALTLTQLLGSYVQLDDESDGLAQLSSTAPKKEVAQEVVEEDLPRRQRRLRGTTRSRGRGHLDLVEIRADDGGTMIEQEQSQSEIETRPEQPEGTEHEQKVLRDHARANPTTTSSFIELGPAPVAVPADEFEFEAHGRAFAEAVHEHVVLTEQHLRSAAGETAEDAGAASKINTDVPTFGFGYADYDYDEDEDDEDDVAEYLRMETLLSGKYEPPDGTPDPD